MKGQCFPFFEMLDAKIASAPRKIFSTIRTSERRASVEEQRAQKHDRFLRVAYMIYDHFRATGAFDASQGLSDLFNICLHDDDSQDCDTRWDQAASTASEVPPENVLDGFYKMKIRGSVQLQTVLTMYDQEMDRDRVMPSDQMISTRNFKARNERIDTRISVKSHKGRIVSVEKKVGECYQWRATGQCARGDSCFSHGSNRGEKAQSSSLAPKARTQTDGRKLLKGFGLRGESPSGRKCGKACKKILRGKCTGPSCDLCHPPLRQNCKSESGCK